jgi:signal transduction histidine kinase
MNRPIERFITPGVSLACIGATAAAVIKVVASGRLSALWFALLLVLAGAYALLGTVGLYLVERRGTRRQLHLVLASMFAAGAGAMAVSRGEAVLLIVPLVTYGVLYLSPAGVATLVAACSAVMVTIWISQAHPIAQLVRELAVWTAALAFVIVISRMLLVQHKARTEMEALAGRLGDANEQLRVQAAEIGELAKVQERNRIARDIHDVLGHYLTVVHVQLEAAKTLFKREPETARAAILKAQALTREGLSEVRRSVSLLRDSSSTERPLLAAIEKLASECKADGIHAAVRLRGTPRALPEPVEITLYRAAQEALTNVRRHARASKLDIELAFASGSGIRLRVEDDGVGSDLLNQGFGLVGLRERAESVGGTMSVRSALGHGFTLEIELPG